MKLESHYKDINWNPLQFTDMRNLKIAGVKTSQDNLHVPCTNGCIKKPYTFKNTTDVLFSTRSITTSGNTGCKRKRVRFADEHGGSLCAVKTIERTPLLSKIKVAKSMRNYTVVYNQTRLFSHNISVVAYGVLGYSNIFGAVAVKNVAFDKQVIVRMTTDNWKSSKDISASFVQQEQCGRVDKFFFMTSLDYDFNEIRACIEFAACYIVDGNEFWDNNSDDNYRF